MELLSEVSGRVLELGVGNGLNLPHYPAGVTEIVAIDPEPYLLSLAKGQPVDEQINVTMARAAAEALPFGDATFDTVVSSLALCSVESPERALFECRRILRPGGTLRFYEHVGDQRPSRLATLQRWGNPVWRPLVGGCRLTLDTEAVIAASGFQIEQCRTFRYRPTWTAFLTSPHVLGSARRC